MFNCSKCGKSYKSTSALNKHISTANCVIQNRQISQPILTSDNQTSSTVNMFSEFMKKMEELENENKRLKDEMIRRDKELNEMKPITTELPYDYEQLTKIIYKYNPYSRQYSIRRNGFVPKDFKSWYTLKYFNILDYPSTKIQFYKKCLEEILKNIPDEKLPYRIRDSNRYVYDIYDYDNKQWIKGKTDDLVQMIIKKFMELIQASLYSATNVFNELNTSDFHALENRRIDPTAFNRLRMELQRDLIYNFSLPDYDDDITEEDKYNFYKKNFVKVMNERLSSEIKVEVNEDEFKEFEETKQEIKNKKQKSKPTLTKITLSFDNENSEEIDFGNNFKISKATDSDDEGYETDTKENPYFDVDYDST